MTDFLSLNLQAPLQEALSHLGYTEPTPIQSQAIPEVLAGRDLMGIAQTGTGKTAAFALPTLNHICLNDKEPPRKGAKVLVLAPTRELASQIAESFRDYGRNMKYLSVATVFGGVPISRHIKQLSGGNDVIVATPGRLIDLLDRRAVSLSAIEVLILDEADQMMDMGFIHALKKIVPLVPKKRQTLFFSATMVPAIAKLAKQFLTDPVKVSVSPANTTAERVEQSLTFIDPGEKQDLLALSLLGEGVNRSLVFTRTKYGADRVVKRLMKVGIDAVAIHGNKSQGQRQRALTAFREGKVDVMVATDVAARGIDIDGITHVFNFEIPNVPEQYVHRIGRTARANASGKAIAFVSPDERKYLKDIQKILKMDIPVVSIPDEFRKKVGQLKSRKPIVKEPVPKNEPRKGRGKSKKKANKAKSKPENSGKGKPSAEGRPSDQRHRARKRPGNHDKGEAGSSDTGRTDRMTGTNPDGNTRSRSSENRANPQGQRQGQGKGQGKPRNETGNKPGQGNKKKKGSSSNDRRRGKPGSGKQSNSKHK